MQVRSWMPRLRMQVRASLGKVQRSWESAHASSATISAAMGKVESGNSLDLGKNEFTLVPGPVHNHPVLSIRDSDRDDNRERYCELQ